MLKAQDLFREFRGRVAEIQLDEHLSDAGKKDCLRRDAEELLGRLGKIKSPWIDQWRDSVRELQEELTAEEPGRDDPARATREAKIRRYLVEMGGRFP